MITSYNKPPIAANFKTGARHALAQPAFCEKILFKPFFKLIVKHPFG